LFFPLWRLGATAVSVCWDIRRDEASEAARHRDGRFAGALREGAAMTV
jgi:hypothetical protein